MIGIKEQTNIRRRTLEMIYRNNIKLQLKTPQREGQHVAPDTDGDGKPIPAWKQKLNAKKASSKASIGSGIAGSPGRRKSDTDYVAPSFSGQKPRIGSKDYWISFLGCSQLRCASVEDRE
jgi:hypothetical protein